MNIHLNDFTLAYDHNGSGNNIVFVHGYPLSRAMWHPQQKYLSGLCSVYAVDLRGHGDSTPTPGDYSIDLFADDLASFINSAGIKRPVILCGLSMGGYISLAFYRKYRHMVSGLILTATKAAADSQEARANRDKAIQTLKNQGREEIFRGMLPKLLAPENLSSRSDLVENVSNIMRNAASEETIEKDLKALRDRPDATPLLAKIKVPTLIIHGAQDQIIPLTEAQAMQAAIPASRLVVLQNAGHLLNLEQPERFNTTTKNFLRQFS